MIKSKKKGKARTKENWCSQIWIIRFKTWPTKLTQRIKTVHPTTWIKTKQSSFIKARSIGTFKIKKMKKRWKTKNIISSSILKLKTTPDWLSELMKDRISKSTLRLFLLLTKETAKSVLISQTLKINYFKNKIIKMFKVKDTTKSLIIKMSFW